MNKSILESTRPMLYEANLSQNFWAEAVATAVYLRNRSPSKILKHVTPYEIFNENKPNVIYKYSVAKQWSIYQKLNEMEN